MHTAKRILIAVGATLIICVAVVVSPFLIDRVRNDARLRRYVRAWHTIQHPPDTERVAFEHKIGLLWGNGNHCDYFVGELRRYDGNRQRIEDHYAGATVAGFSVEVAFLEGNAFSESDRWAMP